MNYFFRKMCVGMLLLMGLASGANASYVNGNPITGKDPLGLYNMDALPPVPGMPPQKSKCPRDWSNYWNNYANFVDQYGIDLGPFALAMLGGTMPKTWAPATGFRGPMLGSTNPLTSVFRGVGVSGMDAPIPRTGAAAIGVATVGIGMYDATVEVEGAFYAIPSPSPNSGSSCSCQ